MTESERHVMAHATGWESKSPLYRNHFCASEGHDDWATLQALCERGLMRIGRKPGPLSGGDTVFVVTDAGVAALRAGEPDFVTPTVSDEDLAALHESLDAVVECA